MFSVDVKHPVYLLTSGSNLQAVQNNGESVRVFGKLRLRRVPASLTDTKLSQRPATESSVSDLQAGTHLYLTVATMNLKEGRLRKWILATAIS